MRQGYDYIVVGAGSAGAPMAARLSEGDADVLLLEAGPDFRSAETPRQFLDRNFGVGLEPRPFAETRDPDFVWAQIAARRTRAQDPYPYRRGRGLGGSSVLNSLSAIRGVPEDFERWVAMGATGWSYEDILWGYNKLERDCDYPDAVYHGGDGPTPIHREPESGWGGADRALRDAAVEFGYEWQDDSNSPFMSGVGRFATTTRDGRRVSTNDGYLEPARERANLEIRGGAHVDRVLIDSNRARGVSLADGTEFTLNRGGEVILCAGAAHSPVILMRSGIGPAAQLSAIGVEAIVDLPVGQGIQDHVLTFAQVPMLHEDMRSAGLRPSNVIVRYGSRLEGAGTNDMQLISANHNYWGGHQTGGIAIQLNECFSRGELTIGSADPFEDPQVEFRLLDDPRDVARMIDAAERCKQLMAHRSFRGIAQGPLEVPDTEESLLRDIRDGAHLCSSARMGDPNDRATVVDPECRVHGIDGLRTIDASVIPEIVRGNINLTVIAIAELMAARIGGNAPCPVQWRD